ncbi:GNAT family N-acetyltransferase [Vallicoccus soli]|uniref:N-acetyltransferase domain-containing protein n=1 Tax=Vallicoccus soli TaxID=2339232 RepID=A0A3A3Z223_9ACTN|nr:GNAT family N-acetyltransferase [Vallicoccus soli]RJK96784.1 hypothetical protein D5H78_05800 [Vallicoccus soli]
MPDLRHPALDRLDAPGVLDRSGGDAYVRAELDPQRLVDGWALGRAAGWVGRRPGRDVPWLSAVGDPADAARLAAAVRARTAGTAAAPHGATLPRGAVPLLAGVEVPVATDWDWFWTDDAPPRRAGEEQVRWLGAGDEDDVAALLAADSPRHSAVPGGPGVVRWCGVRLDGRLAATAAWVEHVRGVPHLASIATAATVRGHGWGAAVTAWVTRALLAEHGWVTLGMYADNGVARAMYRRLGYRDTHLFTSGRFG